LNDNWFDPVIGVRGQWKLSEKWSASALADYGSFSGSSETLQVVGTMNYNINERLSARIGYRHMDVSKTIRGSDVEVGLSGPVIGLTYRF
jgi:opacity protein-like surface antigen